jgi:PTS system beta-glucosides-specific IIC component
VIAAALGGAVVGYAKSSAISLGMPGLLTLPIFYGEGFVGFIIGCSIAFIGSLALTLVVGFDDPVAPPVVAESVPGKIAPCHAKPRLQKRFRLLPSRLLPRLQAPLSR